MSPGSNKLNGILQLLYNISFDETLDKQNAGVLLPQSRKVCQL